LLAGILCKDKVKKTSKTILRLGDIGFRHLDSAAEIRAHLPHFAEQHISRCVLDGRPSQFLRKDYTLFYEYLTEELDPANQIRFSLLEISGKPAAYHFGFKVEGKYLFYKPVFDIDLWDYSPGQVLLFKLFEYFRRSDIWEFDLGQGGEPYKSRYANACRENRTFTVYPPGIAGQLMRACGHAAIAARGRAHVVIDRYPKLQALRDRIEEVAGMGRRQSLFGSGAESRVYRLPDALELRGELGLRPVALRALAEQAAHNPGFLTAGDLHDVRHFLKKGGSVYADRECRCVVLASRSAVAETAAGPVDLGGLGLVFTVLYGAAWNRPALIQAMTEIAAQQGMAGWLVSGLAEPGLKSPIMPGQGSGAR
jgi:hypothetical protein